MSHSIYSSANAAPLSNAQILAKAPSVFGAEKHQSRSDRYTYIPTIEVVDAMRAVGYLPFAVSQSRSRSEGKEEFAKHMIRFRQVDAGRQLLDGTRDEVGEIVVINSHDGTSSYQISAGIYRLICRNGLMVGKTLQDYRIHHKGNIVSDVIDVAARVVSSHSEIDRMVSTLKRIPLTQAEQNQFAEKAIALRFDTAPDQELPTTPERMLRARRIADMGADVWTVYNRVQENTIKGGVLTHNHAKRTRSMSREVKGIDSLIRLNRSLWDLTIETAQAKGEM